MEEEIEVMQRQALQMRPPARHQSGALAKETTSTFLGNECGLCEGTGWLRGRSQWVGVCKKV